MNKIKLLTIAAMSTIPLMGCATIIEEKRPDDISNACHILKENKGWNRTLHFVEKDWGIKPHTILAVMFQESAFDRKARPVAGKRFFFFNRYQSSARGYSQALDATWDEYKEQNDKGMFTRRSSFSDSADFMGWYMDRTHRQTRINKDDAYNLYLAYHEGNGGWSRKTYTQKPWLVETSRRVSQRANRFQSEINNCDFPRGLWSRLFYKY